MAAETTNTFDYIIAGGGQAGCVLASRLSQALPQCSVALIEAGPNAHDNPTVMSPLGCSALHNTELEWNYHTVQQKQLGGRQVYLCSGKLLCGSSGVNYGAWVRGHDKDFDEWGELVNDNRWSYKGLLKYFRRSETHYLPQSETPNINEHGFEGPVHTNAALKYPLGQTLKTAFAENGADHIADANSAGLVYDLSKVHVMTRTPVHKVLLSRTGTEVTATGVQLADGRQLKAIREVIVGAGAWRSPQVLMLSGIGDSKQLQQHGIETKVELPQVGQNLHDHGSVMLYYKLKHPEKGLSFGSPAFPPVKVGPSEWMYTGSVPRKSLEQALAKDGVAIPSQHPHVTSPHAHFEMTVSYGATAVPPELTVPMDGSSITTGQSCFMPTSRGTVTLASADPGADPLIDPQYFATEHDRCIVREALRFTMRLMETPAAKTEVQEQYQAEGMPIDVESSDEELDKRINAHTMSWYHPAGTCAMGTVVDTECRVKGVRRLRVVDASVVPKPIGAHY